ncbi:MAG: hypothetical protein OEV40_27480 [Acidimicrobiia bacterium]|nr:hypothetical protein [Acidimicrobiia bacterium]
MTIRLSKPWLDLEGLDREELPAQLGVFQIADADRNVIFVGYGGGTRAFGLRTAIEEQRQRLGHRARFVRFELTHGYLSRWEELMMVHQHDHGSHPSANDDSTAPRGRLTPIGGPEGAPDDD